MKRKLGFRCDFSRVFYAAFRQRLERFSSAQSGRDCTVIEVVQLSADWHALRQRRQTYAPFELIRDVVGCGLSVDGGAQSEDDFGDVFRLHAIDEGGYAQIVWADGVKRGERAAQDVIAALENA